MREHMGLFRGKRLCNGEWIEGDLYAPNYICDDWCICPRPKVLAIAVDPDTIGECTSLKDKNGKLIFEGDILEYNDGYDYFKGEVIFENGAFGMGSFEIIGLSSGCCDNFANLWQLFWDQEVIDEPELYYCSIIGNTHDDGELLKGGEGNGRD